MQRTEEGDEHAIAAVALQAKHIGRGLRLITATLSPEMILITGDITSSWHRFGPIIEKELRDTMLAGSPPQIALTTDVELSRLRGAAATALQRHSGYHASRHATANSGRRARNTPRPAEYLDVS
jgi:predicted NBD/HSP70 family sugar kinase